MTQRPKVRVCDDRVWYGCQSTVLGPVFLGDPGNARSFLGWGWRPQSGSSEKRDLTRGGQRCPYTPAGEQASTHNHLQELSVQSPVPGAQNAYRIGTARRRVRTRTTLRIPIWGQ